MENQEQLEHVIDEELIVNEEPLRQKDNYNKFMRHYMKNYYCKNKDKIKNQRNSANYKKKNNIPDDVAEKYGEFLYNVMQYKQLLLSTPKELIDEITRDVELEIS